MKTNETKHTPVKWKVGRMFNGEHQIQTDGGCTVAIAVRQTDKGDNYSGCPVAAENAAFIVRAVNSHADLLKQRDELLEALKEIADTHAALLSHVTNFQQWIRDGKDAGKLFVNLDTSRDKQSQAQARAALATATDTEKSELNWIVTYNGEPIRRLMFEGGKTSIIVGTVTQAIRYTPEEAAEVAVAIGRGAEVVNATKGDK